MIDIKKLSDKYDIILSDGKSFSDGEITYVFHSGEIIGKDILKKERVGQNLKKDTRS